MKYLIPLLVIFFISMGSAMAQSDVPETPAEDSSFMMPAPLLHDENLPVVNLNIDNAFLMRAFYPEYYADENLIRKDIRFVSRNDSDFVANWDSLGTFILATLQDLSGIKWNESTFDIHLVKYFRTNGTYDPLLVPLEGIKMKNYIEAAPSGMHRLFNLIQLLAGRNILQVKIQGHENQFIADHPLLDQSAYRFDLVALSLALACAEQLMPSDSIHYILNSEPWKRHNPGWEVFENHFRYSWVLSPEKPLVYYLMQEGYDSPLIGLTKPPKIKKEVVQKNNTREPIKLSAKGGRIGFSVIKNARGYLQVVDVDTLGLAYASGLAVDDWIKRVNGEVVRNARSLMSKILDKIDTEGVYLLVMRQNQEVGILLLPPEEEENQ
jgi:hypothetical protein